MTVVSGRARGGMGGRGGDLTLHCHYQIAAV